VSGSEDAFANLMNQKAKSIGMNNTRFINATGLTEKGQAQYSTAYDLTRLMRRAAKNRTLDEIMGIQQTWISGSDGKALPIRSHNKMLWRTPKYLKGKTGWTFAARHTFVGTDYSPKKRIMFAMLASQQPWIDIERLAILGHTLKQRR
jgi:serine-type D-Ala-D-Ala carboxypeptidase (penicillin-binding protein 5/6)